MFPGVSFLFCDLAIIDRKSKIIILMTIVKINKNGIMNSLTIEYGQLFLYLYDKIVTRPVFENWSLGDWLKIVSLEHLFSHGKYSFPMLDAVLGFYNLAHCGIHLLQYCRHVSIVYFFRVNWFKQSYMLSPYWTTSPTLLYPPLSHIYVFHLLYNV